MRIVVAMSGGVDSSTAAGLLVEAGHEVIGLAMKTHVAPAGQSRACCTPEDMRDARRVADHLGIRFYVVDYQELFASEIIRPFAEAYRQGRTPNPCIDCNDRVKFRTLLARAELLGAEKLATGHYARLLETPAGPALGRGLDRRKDQSYFLYRLGRTQLDKTLFPVGALRKDEVRAHARRLGLPVAEKGESQEICFVGAAGYAATVAELCGEGTCRAGAIVDAQGATLGRHEGVHHFTVGQRRGLGIAAPQPLYVTDIDAGRGLVRVGSRDELLVTSIELEDATFALGPPGSAEPLEVQQRYRESPKPARLELLAPGRARLRFESPVPRGAPGQAAVIYQGERVVGGGTIAPSSPAASQSAAFGAAS